MTTFYRRLPRFDYVQPASLDEALSLFAQYQKDAKPMAGGTDLIPQLKGREVATPRVVVDLKAIPGLNGISYDPAKGMAIGALATITSVERSPVVMEHYPMLAQALTTLASPQVRNRATITGNICSAVPSADSAPTLLAMEAQVKAVSRKGERLIPVTQFFMGPRQTVLANDELITEIRIPAPPARSRGVYLKLSPRKSMDLAVVGVAAFVVKEGDMCKDVRIALGAVAPTPIREPRAESALQGKKMTDEAIEEAARAASSECRPIDDHRAAREYRCDMVYVLTRRALAQIKEEAL
ncbi:MAG TPA: xanthine dehydrogenase family protein subunit M [Syntrophorhabdales bacterium]|nr:xanthine dehydrogenase family protein subunit M [Syntrophorhabdales bacterium]